MKPNHSLITIITTLASGAVAQLPGTITPENHPSLSWQRCTTSSSSCEAVPASIVLDAEQRVYYFLNDSSGADLCYEGNEWDLLCDNLDRPFCIESCGLDGAEYESVYGISTDGDSLELRYRTAAAQDASASKSLNAQVFLLEEGGDRYQTFTLAGNEVAFDVDLSAVPCGLNAALRFVQMDPDGGMARYEENEAGARYGLGYCDATCSRELKYVGGMVRSHALPRHVSSPFVP